MPPDDWKNATWRWQWAHSVRALDLCLLHVPHKTQGCLKVVKTLSRWQLYSCQGCQYFSRYELSSQLIYSLNFGLVTDRQTESDAYEPTMQCDHGGSKIKEKSRLYLKCPHLREHFSRSTQCAGETLVFNYFSRPTVYTSKYFRGPAPTGPLSKRASNQCTWCTIC